MKRVFTVLFAVLMLCGCDSTQMPIGTEEPQGDADTSISDTDTPEYTEEYYIALATEIAGEAVQTAISQTAATADTRVSAPYQKPDKRDALTDTQKAVYVEMLAAVKELRHFTYGADKLADARVAASALIYDNPLFEIYFRVEDATDGDTPSLKSVYFLPSDADGKATDDFEALRREIRLFEAICDFVIGSMPKELSDCDKYFYIAAYISAMTEYDHKNLAPSQNRTAYGAIVGGYSICQGYAVGFEYLCSLAGFNCSRIEGRSGKLFHMWNTVTLDGTEYHIDVTWSDNGIYKPHDDGWMKYFLITRDKVLEDHIISD